MKKVVVCALVIVFAVYIICSTSPEKIKVYMHLTGESREMDFEEYITGVLCAEMPASFEMEALKAQAVAVRTYTRRKLGTKLPEHKGADICTDSGHCQAFGDINKINESHRKKIISAARDTEGEILIFGDEIVNAVYHAASHGYTECAADVWGGDVPYLKSVESPWDGDSPYYAQEVTFTYDELYEKLNLPLDMPLNPREVRSPAGSISEITLAGRKFAGTEIRNLLGLRSTCFSAKERETDVVFTVSGYGHGVGMSQWGAQGMASEGYDYREILTHYYTGTIINK